MSSEIKDTSLVIQTVYKPEENLDYIKDWLVHHTAIGVKHFYLYDNGGAHNYPDPDYNVPLHLNKHGTEFKYTVEQARELEAKILRNFPVTKIMWQNRDANGQLMYNQPESIVHFKNIVNTGLCAFIDIDEFIIKREDFRPCRLYQRKFKSRVYYNSVYDCRDVWDIEDASKWGPKVILDMANFPIFTPGLHAHDIHFRYLDLPISQSWFNHYNHTLKTHWYLLNVQKNDHNLGPMIQNIKDTTDTTDIEKHFNSIFCQINDTGLIN